MLQRIWTFTVTLVNLRLQKSEFRGDLQKIYRGRDMNNIIKNTTGNMTKLSEIVTVLANITDRQDQDSWPSWLLLCYYNQPFRN